MKDFIRKNIRIIAGVIVGGLGGFLYWHFIGCTGDSCALASSPLYSTLWGAVIGGLFMSAFKRTPSS